MYLSATWRGTITPADRLTADDLNDSRNDTDTEEGFRETQRSSQREPAVVGELAQAAV